MPVLFAATLFLSASLLFMVQPMVGKMVLPLLGGSPAVWNACMVFFQALLLLGYLYAHHVSGKYSARKQWLLHSAVLGLPLAAFFLAVTVGARHSPIAIVESLAPGEGSSPVLHVLLLLSVAIGVPFLVVSTSAPLLQKWFTCTGHPSSRDPYFLYAASNLGSMISLLGYPLFIEPNLSIVEQAWVFAGGFALLAVLIAICGYAAAHPIAVPSAELQAKNKEFSKGGQPRGQQTSQKAIDLPSEVVEPAPTLARKLKWIALAFVPSSMMLGVTFYMTTDIASLPLLWVLPLTLYLITFIIAFARVPDWFRLVIGNLAPVMILLLVFVRLSQDSIGFGQAILITLYLATFFATALMCHYELARDRPAPKYLTGFFLLMSVGGVFGGIFNSLVAPIIFPDAYELALVLIVACMLVPKLSEEDAEARMKKVDKFAHESAKYKQMMDPVAAYSSSPNEDRREQFRRRRALVLDFAIPIFIWGGFALLIVTSRTDTFGKMCLKLSNSISVPIGTIQVMLINAPIVMLCFFFVDRPVRFALCVAAILGYFTYLDFSPRGQIYTDRSFFGILKVNENIGYQDQRPVFEVDTPDGKKQVTGGRLVITSLQHGTTLHGKQMIYLRNNVLDMFQALTALNPLDNFIVANANHRFNVREEPLTYYHRTGPVGAMFQELRTRKGGADAKAPFAMVGLGTGSAACYTLPGQHMTFYEIDTAVIKIVEKPWKVMNEEERKADPSVSAVYGPFSYVDDARKRGGTVDIHVGDARIKLKEDTDRKYALLLVDAFSSDSIPVHLLTREAVQLYLDRMTPDGILALHISNKFVNLEPVASAIARDLGLAGVVWNDTIEERGHNGLPGKTSSSWVALARSKEHLGGLYSPLGALVFDSRPAANGDERQQVSMGLDAALWMVLATDFDTDLTERITVKDGVTKKRYQQLNESQNPKEEWLAWIRAKMAKVTDPVEKERLKLYEEMFEEFGETRTLQDVMLSRHAHAFRKLEYYREVPAWTDDYSDVMRVMTMKEVQAIRKFFGLPTPLER